jgi:hypothetical protein
MVFSFRSCDMDRSASRSKQSLALLLLNISQILFLQVQNRDRASLLRAQTDNLRIQQD